MAGRRSLTPLEERMLIAITRKMTPRDGCLVTCQWMTGYRISEVLRITVGTVLKHGEIVPKIGLAPRQMKGGYGMMQKCDFTRGPREKRKATLPAEVVTQTADAAA